jgi:type IV secretory pathway TrbL component
MRIDSGIQADWQAQIQQLSGDAQTEEARGLRLGLKRRERQAEELDRLRTELRRRQRAAAKQSSLTKIVGAALGVVLAAVSTVATIYCPPAAAGIVAGGALVCASLGVGAAVLDSNAMRAKASEIEAGALIDRAGQERLELLGALEQVVAADRRVGEFVRGWIEADSDARDHAARAGGQTR